MSRRKGAAGERELCALLRDHLGVEAARLLGASRDGGHDIQGLPGIALECKRQDVPSLGAWWAQAFAQGIAADALPVLAYRLPRRPWRFVLPVAALIGGDWRASDSLALTLETSAEGFAAIVREVIV